MAKQRTAGDYTPAQKARAVRKYRAGESQAELAREFGCSNQSIADWVRKADAADGISKSLPIKSAETKTRSKMRKVLVASGYSCPHCGEAVEVPE